MGKPEVSQDKEQEYRANESAKAIADNDARIEMEHQREQDKLLLTPEEMAEAIGRPVKFINWQHETVAKAQLAKACPIIEKQVRREVGEELCCLIGNKMLEDMEAGKLLGNQLREYMKRYLKGEPL